MTSCAALNDRVAELFVELAQSHVGFGRGALDDAEGAHDRCRLPLPTDLEIAEAALGLRAPVAIGGTSMGPNVSVSVRVLFMIWRLL